MAAEGQREQQQEDKGAFDYEFDLENPFTSPADEPIASLLAAEGQHSPSVIAVASDTRRAAAGFIFKWQFGGEIAVHPRIAYLALNYVDRFLTKRVLPYEQRPWAPRLLAISCLSLAAKMQGVANCSLVFLQWSEDFMIDLSTVRRMERVVLDALEWRTRSVTPLAFLDFFLSACYPPLRHAPQVAAVKARAVDLVLRSQPEVKMAEFSPSVAASAALLAATGEIAAENLTAFRAGVTACPFVNSVKLRQCGDVIAAACGVGPGFSAVSADTPVTVLRHHRSASSESERTVGSVGNGGGDAKKRCMGPPSQWG